MAVIDNTETREELLEIVRAARLKSGDPENPVTALWFSDELTAMCNRMHGLDAALGGMRPFAGGGKMREGVAQLLEDVIERAEALTEIFEAERPLARGQTVATGKSASS